MTHLNSAFLLHLLLAVMNGSIGAYVYLRSPRELVNRVFGFVGLAIAAWALTIGFSHNPATSNLLAVRASFAVATLLLLGLLTLFHVFPASPFPMSRTYVLFSLVGLVFAGVAFSDLLVSGATYTASGLTVSYGRWHWLFGLYASVCLGYSAFVLWQKVRTSTGLKRLQLRYLVLGLVIPGLAVAVTNLFIPLVFNVSRFGRYGPAFSLAFLGLTAHAIIRHRLMNIRLVISRSVAYVLAVTFSGAVFAALAGLISNLLTARQWEVPLWLAVGLVFPVALLFQPMKRLFQLSVDRYLFREPYDYQQVIREATRRLGTTLDLRSLLNYLCAVISKTLRPERVAIYIRSTEPIGYKLAAQQSIEDAETAVVLPGDSPLTDTLSRTKRYLVQDELAFTESEHKALTHDLSHLRADCVFPIFEDTDLVGLLILGPKLSGDPYFPEDLDLLTTLVGQGAIAVKNAQLYREVVLVNEYIENILATMESGVIAISADSTITLFNSAAERMTQLHAARIKGLPLHVLPAALSASLQASLSDGHPRPHFETVITTAHHDPIPVICSTSILRDRSSTILGAMSVFSDLTRLKRLEADKQRAERLASIGALASGIAHEIKNPLVAIKTFAELLPERFADEDFRGDFAKVVVDEIDRIDDLVARLRGLATPPTARLVSLDLRDSIDETLSLLRGQLEQMRITVVTQLPESPLFVAADRAQLRQLFLNLLINALEAMTFGGELVIRAAASGIPSSKTAVVEIQDTGAGIPDTLMKNIFDPFITTKVKGSGLGLFICRGIADAHRATIRARNNVGITGATLVIEFPLLQHSPIPLDGDIR